ncbi:MAG: D-amino-acid transaminase [Chitinophagales bacterium]|nr:D-amino-acid transaminase [Hyphomicrobiales bacterium]
MSRIIYVNGEYRNYPDAHIHVEDRSVQFADGVYEVCEVLNGCLVDERLHMQRLLRSLGELQITPPMSLRAIGVILRETVRRNGVVNGTVYLQITRGAARRDFIFPAADTPCGVICLARRASPAANDAKAARGLKVITVPDIRWRRPDIKSISLLPNALAKQAAKDAGADDAWFVDDAGYVTEGASNNAWILNRDSVLVTRQADTGILRGVTRQVLLAGLAQSSYRFEERAFSVEEAKSAREAFLTSASALIMPVVSIDGAWIGDGVPGNFATEMRRLFHNHAKTSSKHVLLT